MTERERWIVYPLLFLALGASLRDKLFNLTQAQTVVCEKLSADQIRTRVLDADQILHRGQKYVPGGNSVQLITPEQLQQLRQIWERMRAAGEQPAPPPQATEP
jgi:hypothetical protein